MLNKLICFIFGHEITNGLGWPGNIRYFKICPRCGGKL